MIIILIVLLVLIMLVVYILKAISERKTGKEEKREKIELSANNPAAILLREGQEALEQSNYEMAQEKFEKYLRLNPFDEEVKTQLEEVKKKITLAREKRKEEIKKEEKKEYDYVLKKVRIVTVGKTNQYLKKEEAKEILKKHVQTFINEKFVSPQEAKDFLEVNTELIEREFCRFYTDANGTVIIRTNASRFILVHPDPQEYSAKKWSLSNFDRWGLRKI
jgi:tetratricopeptide (TPR) repeat protein